MSRRGPLIAGIASGVLALLLILFLVLPKMGEVDTAKAQLQTAQEQEQQLRLQLQQLEAAKAQAPQVTAELNKIQNLIPPTVDEPGMILALSDASSRAGVDFFTMSPTTPTPSTSGSFSVIPTSVSVTGSYFACEEFLYNVEHLDRAAKVLSLSLATGGGDSAAAPAGATGPVTTSTGELSMQLNMEFYTTDTSAGPGSEPGPSEPASDIIGTTPTPSPSGA